jgi:YVTN family beta-propeller protein
MGLLLLTLLGMTVASPDGRRIYSTTPDKNVLNVMDPKTPRAIQSVDVGPSPTGLAVSPDGRRVFVCIGGKSEIQVIDTASLMKVKTIPVGNSPQNIYVTPDNTRMIATSGRKLSIINIRTETVEFEIPLGGVPGEITIESDKKTLVISRILVKESAPNGVEIVDYAAHKVLGKAPKGT